MSSEKTKKSVKKAEPPLLDWLQIAKKPIALYHTLKGPVIGHVALKDSLKSRIYAPAMVGSPAPGKIIFLPVLFCEEYIELFWTTMFGVSPPPDIVLQGYKGYFEQFIKGAYKLQPIIIDAGISGVEHTIGDPRVLNSEGLAACPACKAMLSHWAAHYPVRIGSIWTCEVAQPDIREAFPDYDASAAFEREFRQPKEGDANGSAAS